MTSDNVDVNLMPSCWGPAMWHSIHSIAISYPLIRSNEVRNSYYTFFSNLGNILPCAQCKEHYRDNFNSLKDSLLKALNSTERYDLFRFTYDLHNLVNEQTNVPRNKWPEYQDILDKYISFKSPDGCKKVEGACGVVPGKVPKKRIVVVEKFDSGQAGSYALYAVGGIIGLAFIYMIYKKYYVKPRRKITIHPHVF
jgi:hypothetical protein